MIGLRQCACSLWTMVWTLIGQPDMCVKETPPIWLFMTIICRSARGREAPNTAGSHKQMDGKCQPSAEAEARLVHCTESACIMFVCVIVIIVVFIIINIIVVICIFFLYSDVRMECCTHKQCLIPQAGFSARSMIYMTNSIASLTWCLEIAYVHSRGCLCSSLHTGDE